MGIREYEIRVLVRQFSLGMLSEALIPFCTLLWVVVYPRPVNTPPLTLEVNPSKTCMSLWAGNVPQKAFRAFQGGRISKSYVRPSFKD